jgi:hypothetical protein
MPWINASPAKKTEKYSAEFTDKAVEWSQQADRNVKSLAEVLNTGVRQVKG